MFGMRNNRIQTELRSRSNEKLAVAVASAGAANERAAKLEKESATIRYQFELDLKERAPRILSADQRNTLVSMLKGKMTDVLFVIQRDAEAERYAFQVISALNEADIETRIQRMPVGIYTQLRQLVIYSPSQKDDLTGELLFDAIKAAGLYGGQTKVPAFALDMEHTHPSALKLPGDAYILYVCEKP